MGLRLLRAVYAIEFLVAVAATLEVWREVGGQAHLDLMPWYVKLFFTLGLSAAIVQLTAVSSQLSRGRTILWLGIVLLFLVAGALVTYYYHLNEPPDPDDENAVFMAGLRARHASLILPSEACPISLLQLGSGSREHLPWLPEPSSSSSF